MEKRTEITERVRALRAYMHEKRLQAFIFPSTDPHCGEYVPEHWMTPKKEGELPPMMRIFAMIRIGITNNNSIATALNYSYNTVHNYRVRVRNMSYNPEDFEDKVAKIGSSIK